MSVSDQARKKILDHGPFSGRFRGWLDENVLSFADVAYTRSEISALTRTPCLRAVKNLHETCAHFQIHSLAQLNRVGLDGLLRCAGLGERAAFIASIVLEDHGYDVEAWLDRKTSTSWQEHIQNRARAARRRKQPAA